MDMQYEPEVSRAHKVWAALRPCSGRALRARRLGLVVAGLVIGLGFAAYLPSLRGGFVYDDHFLVENNYAIRSLAPSNVVRVLTGPINDTYRPARVLSYAVDYHLWGLNPLGFRLSNLLLHLVNGVLVYLIVSRLLGSRWPAAFAALLFTLHPIQTEAVAWISGRKDVLATAFALGSFLAYLHARAGLGPENEALGRDWRGLGALGASVGLFAGALLSKEGAVTMVAVMFFYELLGSAREEEGRLQKSVVAILPYLGVGIVFVAIYFGIGHGHGTLTSYHEGGRTATFVLMVKGFAYYVWLLFVPAHLCADYNTFGGGGMDLPFFVSGATLAGIAFLVVLGVRRASKPWQTVMVFGALWFFISLAPVSNVVPIAARIAERYLYLPFVGVCIAAAAVAAGGYKRWPSESTVARSIPGFLGCVLLLFLCALTAHRVVDWTSDRRLWESCLRSYPDSPRVNYSLGHLFHKRLAGCSVEERRSPNAEPVLLRAAFHFNKALDAEAQYAKALVGLAHVELDRGNKAKALDLMGRAALSAPYDPLVRADYGGVLMSAGMRDAGIKELTAAVSLAPEDPDFLVYLGTAYLDAGRFQEAIGPLEKALALAPTGARIAFYLSYAREHLQTKPQ